MNHSYELAIVFEEHDELIGIFETGIYAFRNILPEAHLVEVSAIKGTDWTLGERDIQAIRLIDMEFGKESRIALGDILGNDVKELIFSDH